VQARGEDADGRRLPGAVGAQEAQDRPGRDSQVDPPQGVDAAVRLAESLGGDGELEHGILVVRRAVCRRQWFVRTTEPRGWVGGTRPVASLQPPGLTLRRERLQPRGEVRRRVEVERSTRGPSLQEASLLEVEQVGPGRLVDDPMARGVGADRVFEIRVTERVRQERDLTVIQRRVVEQAERVPRLPHLAPQVLDQGVDRLADDTELVEQEVRPRRRSVPAEATSVRQACPLRLTAASEP